MCDVAIGQGVTVDRTHMGRGDRALDVGQFRFWSNSKVPFYVHFWHKLVIWDILSQM